MGKVLCTKGMVILWHGEADYRVEMVKGFPRELEGNALRIPRFPRAFQSAKDLSRSASPWARTLRALGAEFALPMAEAEGPVGLLAFGGRMGKGTLAAAQRSYLVALANLSATAVKKSHGIAELQVVNRKLDRKVQELNTLFELGKEFGSLLETEKLIRLLVFSLMGQVGVHRYLICVRNGEEMSVVASRVDGPLPQRELLASMARLKAPVLVENFLGTRSDDPRPILSALGLAVIVPILLKDEIRGILLLGEKLSREPFSQGDLEFLSSLGNLAVISLDNARLFQEALEKQKMEDELLIAREIQKGLLPSVLPSLEHLDIAAANISSKQVGGDYFDVVPLEGGRALVAIGDVSGKGTPAALLMANLQAAIRALVPLDLTLSEFTGRVNDLMCRNTGGNKFVTLFWGILDPRSLTLRYVNAGHNYPMLIRATGAVERLERGGMILGIMKTNLPYEEGTVRLFPGDLLALFTDGVSEAMSRESVEYGEERLESVLRHSVGLTAEAVLAAVHDDVLRHAKGASQSDDITMMVIRPRPGT